MISAWAVAAVQAVFCAGGLFPDVNIFPNQALYTSLVIFAILLVIMLSSLFLNLTL